MGDNGPEERFDRKIIDKAEELARPIKHWVDTAFSRLHGNDPVQQVPVDTPDVEEALAGEDPPQDVPVDRGPGSDDD